MPRRSRPAARAWRPRVGGVPGSSGTRGRRFRWGRRGVARYESSGRATDPLYRARRTLHTGADLLTDKQSARLEALFAGDEHVQVEATWGIYQRMIAAYRDLDRTHGRELMTTLIDSVASDVPRALTELTTLGRTLKEARRRRPGLLRTPRHVERTDRSPQRSARAPARLRPRVPQPDQLHRQEPARDRRLQTSSAMSQQCTER